MRLFNRLILFLLVFIFYLGLNTFQLPIENTIFMQVETKVDALYIQETESVFTYDKEVMKVLANCKYSRFSIKTSNGEDVLSDLYASFVLSEEINGDTVEYYYSPILETYVYVSGEKVNLQVGESDGITTIGYPMIDVGF
ncbi:MAG: hypothetical protein R3Y32_09395 [Bacillota bacterium]